MTEIRKFAPLTILHILTNVKYNLAKNLLAITFTRENNPLYDILMYVTLVQLFETQLISLLQTRS